MPDSAVAAAVPAGDSQNVSSKCLNVLSCFILYFYVLFIFFYF